MAANDLDGRNATRVTLSAQGILMGDQASRPRKYRRHHAVFFFPEDSDYLLTNAHETTPIGTGGIVHRLRDDFG